MAKRFDREAMPYRPCVGVMVLNGSGQVWVGRRNDGHDSLPLEYLWQMPQGGIDDGEDPWDAARRELYEETNISSVDFIDAVPDWVNYDLPDDLLGRRLKGLYRGQTQKWFAVRFTGSPDEIDIINPGGGHHKPEFDQWRWAEADELIGLIVPFKRQVYETVIATFRTRSVLPAQSDISSPS